MRGGDIRPGVERDTAELFVVQFEGVSRLSCRAVASRRRRVDAPVCHARPRAQSTHKDHHLRPARIASASPRAIRKPTPHPPHTVGDGLFPGAGFAQNPDFPPRTSAVP